jgi:hypothetical protein
MRMVRGSARRTAAVLCVLVLAATALAWGRAKAPPAGEAVAEAVVDAVAEAVAEDDEPAYVVDDYVDEDFDEPEEEEEAEEEEVTAVDAPIPVPKWCVTTSLSL